MQGREAAGRAGADAQAEELIDAEAAAGDGDAEATAGGGDAEAAAGGGDAEAVAGEGTAGGVHESMLADSVQENAPGEAQQSRSDAAQESTQFFTAPAWLPSETGSPLEGSAHASAPLPPLSRQSSAAPQQPTA